MAFRAFYSLAIIALVCISQSAAQQNSVAPFTLSTNAPPYTAVDHTKQIGTVWNAAGPAPTNYWFTNLFLDGGKNPVDQMPYLIRTADKSVNISSPGVSNSKASVMTVFIPNLSVGCSETVTRSVTAYDQLGVNIDWKGADNKKMSLPLVRGSPYVTMIYNGLTPFIDSNAVILKVNDQSPKTGTTGTRFKINMNNGQTWIIYASNSITLDCSGDIIRASAPYTGTLRAIIKKTDDESLLDAHAVPYPTGGDVSYTVENDTAYIHFDWKVVGTGELLMFAVPHQLDILQGANIVMPKAFKILKGFMSGVIGNKWVMKETLTKINWNSPRPIAADKLDAIKAALQIDVDNTGNSPGDPYGFGKSIARLGRLALIADEVGNTELAGRIRGKMRSRLNPWMWGNNTNSLRYDRTWKGLCSKQGLANEAADYGNGWYNDHHFHYGYIIYAAAVVGKKNPEWLQANRESIMAMVRDIANPNTADTHFPVARLKDFYWGHSWASGLYSFGDNKNQESTSESVNGYYGIQLLGLAMGDTNLYNWGRVLLATELRSTHKYWQITSGSEIYASPFADRKVVGILWGLKVDYATWFGSAAQFIHCIQMLPFTPITEELLPASWITEEYPVLSGGLTSNIDDGWRGFVHMALAIIDKAEGWNQIQTLRAYDGGNSKTNALWWAATRP